MAGVRPLLAVVLVLLLTSIYCARFGYNGRFTCHCADNRRCDRTTGACSSGGCEKGWSGPSCQRQNVALNKPAKQSSYYYPSYTGISDAVVSGYAVDGDVSHRRGIALGYGKSRCVDMYGIISEEEIGWWSVDLEETYHLNTIKIYHRDIFLERFAGVSVYIVDEHGDSTLCYNNTRQPWSSSFTIKCNGTGRYLNFTRSTGDRKLNLCEVEVYVCSDGTFGDTCSNFCHCEEDERCDDVTGDCHGNCSPGWKGRSCNQKCRYGYYGAGCTKRCSDRKCRYSSDRCDPVTGKCWNGCKPGWTGDDCTNKCNPGTYGRNCGSNCRDRHCENSSECNHVNGHCVGGCLPGWKGANCNQACSQGKYGKDCKYWCNNRKCRGSSDCNITTGRCIDGCQNGWTGEDCTRECSDDYYGAGCKKKCSDRKCGYPSNRCDHGTGKCENGCKPGWTGDDCTNECSQGKYGKDCKYRCYNRKCHGSSDCNITTGRCSGGCQNGWTEDDCTRECPEGRYGANCQKSCSERHCKGSEKCDPSTGKCEGGCQSGLQGEDCTKACPKGRFGDKCLGSCSNRHCKGSTWCNHQNGYCENGCLPGYEGDTCERECPKGSYGFDCQKSCSERHCKGSEKCDPSTGRCEGGCQSGWEGEDCTRACPEGRFGDQCLGNCSKRHCKGSTSCNHQNGYCENGCLPGYKGDTCEKACPKGRFGDKCLGNCSKRHCKGSTSCNHQNGHCENGCLPGYMEDTCERECPKGSYGFDCQKSCSERHCKGSEKCDPSTGRCEGGCQSGLQGEDCTKACPEGRFGDQCLGNCSNRHCKGSTSCNHQNGHCENGCLPGYKGRTCERECESGFYGGGCKSNCTDRKCLNMTSYCDHVAGWCNGGCKPEYYGIDCSVFKETIATSLGFPVGVAVSIIIPVAVVFIVCLVEIVLLRRRRANHSQTPLPMSVKGLTESKMSSEIAPSTSAVQDQTYARPKRREDDPNMYGNTDGNNGETQDEDYYSFAVIFKFTENFLKDFEKFILDIKSKGGFQQMFEDIPDDFSSSYNISQLPENRNKSSFDGYFPYDNTRVILEKQNGDPHSDFINASYIDGWKNPKAYIAAQGATAITINDFVRMIWEQKCPKVVMLTNLYEMGKMECERYWPESGNEQFGDILLTLEEEKVRADYTVRQIIMTKGNSSHMFYHFHYTSWSDHDVPNISDLLDFLYTVNTSSPQSDQPQLVHCSAGVGRTGTYIAIDVGLKQGEDTRGVDVIHIIEKMRDQRKGMIQTCAQLQCVYEALLEGLTYGNTCKKLTEFMSEYETKSNNMVMGRLTLSSQYQDLVRFKGENEAKTRKVLIDGVVSTACLLPSRTSVRGMVLGELKDYDTEALWKIILHEQCSVVVCLLTEKSNIISPPLGKKETFGSLTLERKNEEILEKSLSMMTVSACLNTVGEEKSVKVFLLDMKNVKKLKSVTQQMKLLLDQVNIHDSCQFPVAVFSSDKDCGKLFCVLRNIAQRIQLDEEVEVFYNVRRLHQQGSSLIKSKEDYMEIYKFVSNYVQSNNIYENC